MDGMKTMRTIALTIVACLLGTAAGQLRTEYDPGATFLMVWPSARSTALAGAVTALADDAEAERYNPAGMAFQDRRRTLPYFQPMSGRGIAEVLSW
jgi:hypothetical protein